MEGSEIFRVVRTLVIFTIVVMALWFVIMIRDYRFTVTNGRPTFVARISIPVPGSVNIKNNEYNKLTLSCGSQSGADGYEFEISRFSNMFFPHSYQSATSKKEIGKLKPGKTYYVRVRCYRKNASGRMVYGRWSGISRSMTKEEANE